MLSKNKTNKNNSIRANSLFELMLLCVFIGTIILNIEPKSIRAEDTTVATTTTTTTTTLGTETTTAQQETNGGSNQTNNSNSNSSTGDVIISKEQTEDVTSGSSNVSVPISITDVCSINAISEGKKLKLKFGETSTETTTTATASSSSSSTVGLFDAIGDLETEYTNDLTGNNGVTVRFPSTIVGSADIANLHELVQNNKSTTEGKAVEGATMKPIMYGMLLDLDMFRSNMYSSWITVDGDGGNYGSLEWWNGWLNTNGYSYNIDKDKLLGTMSEQYNFDVTGKGYIMLDLDTIQGIKNMYDEEDIKNTIKLWRTIYKLLGFVLFGYSLLLQVAWLIDTQFNTPGLLSIMTCGKWQAVTDKNLVTDKNSKVQYLTYSSVFMRSILVIALGSLLIFSDPIELIDLVLQLLGNLSEMLERAITG